MVGYEGGQLASERGLLCPSLCKSRFCLLSDALVDPDELKNAADKIGRPFRPLNRDFRLRVQDTLELKSESPEQSWWPFDYHLDWLFAALEIAEKCNDVEEIDAAFVVPPKNLSKVHSNDGRFTFNIEDCDLKGSVHRPDTEAHDQPSPNHHFRLATRGRSIQMGQEPTCGPARTTPLRSKLLTFANKRPTNRGTLPGPAVREVGKSIFMQNFDG